MRIEKNISKLIDDFLDAEKDCLKMIKIILRQSFVLNIILFFTRNLNKIQIKE
jgi:hypothetical protein